MSESTLTKLTADLIRFQSIDKEGNRRELKRIIDWLERKLKILPGVYLQRFEKNQKPCLVATFRKNEKKPAIFLNGHLDVIPADKPQFKPKLKGNRLYGRGAYDMKGACAVMISLIEYFSKQKKKPDAGFMFVTDEETSGENGSKMLFQRGYRPKLLITLEPTNFEIVVETKGILWMEGIISGKVAHGSMPWLGKNPVEVFHKSLGKLFLCFPPLRREQWKTTLNIGEVTAGDCYNRTPPSLSFKLDIRYVPEEKPRKIIHDVKKCFPKNTHWKIQQCSSPHKKAKDFRLIHRLRQTLEAAKIETRYSRAPFCTDARFFSKGGINCAVFGPKGDGLHGPSEWVNVESLKILFRVMKKYIS